MLASRRLGLGLFAVACSLCSTAALAQQATPAPAQSQEPAAIAPLAPAAPGPAPVAPIAPVAPAAPVNSPAAAPKPAPVGPTVTPTAVPAGPQLPPPKDDEQKPSPSEPPAAPPAEPAASAAPSTATAAADAEINLDENTAGEPGSEEEESPLPWSASIEWGQSYNANGLMRDSQRSFDPQYVWDFLLALGYRLDPLTKLALRQPLTVELTDSDSTASRQELWMLDTTLDLTRQLWKVKPVGQAWVVSGGVGLVLPISPASQAANVILGTRAKLGLSYDTKRVMHGLSAGTGIAYLRRWAGSNTVSIDDTSNACLVGSDDISHSCTHQGGASTTRDVIKLDVHGELAPIDKLTLSASFSLGWNLAHGLADANIPISTGTSVHLEDTSTTHWRNTREIALGVGYKFTDWFSAEANAVNGFSERGPDGELRGPFHAVDIALGLNLILNVDQLYLAGRDGAAGSR